MVFLGRSPSSRERGANEARDSSTAIPRLKPHFRPASHIASMSRMPPPFRRRATALALALCTVFSFPRPAVSHPLADLEIGDPLERELRLLDVIAPELRGNTIALSHLHTRPLLRDVFSAESLSVAARGLARDSWIRIGRGLGRDAVAVAEDSRPRSTPYALRVDGADLTRFDLSPGLEGGAATDRDSTRWANGSGVQLRAALGVHRWIAQLHLLIGEEAGAQSFTDPVIGNSDVILQADQALVGYIAPQDRFGFRLGRSRFHWGPGYGGSLLLSGTAPPLTAFEYHFGLAGGRLRLTALSATVAAAAGEQLAAHRIEWQATDALRLGASESARYHASGWSPLYTIGLIPYSLVQRLQTEDEPDSAEALRNNVMISLDAAWRVANGTRLYGELLVDDLHSRTSDNPDKLAYQVGWDGVGNLYGTRLSWNGEYTRLSRYVYTSFFGREAASQGIPLGFPTGPDASRLTLDMRWDPSADWQVIALAARTEKGENDLGEPFVPGSPRPPIWTFEGVLERARSAELGLRWWPAGGVDAAVTGGYEWRENVNHVSGVDRHGAIGSITLNLHR